MASTVVRRKPHAESPTADNVDSDKAKGPADGVQAPSQQPSRKKLLARPELFLALLVVVTACLGGLRITGRWPFSSSTKVFDKDGLSRYDGKGDTPFYLAILGEVFDVTKGRRFYEADKGYGGFVGRDASRAFVTGDFEADLTDSVADLAPEQLRSLLDWRDFYHKTYPFKGRLHGAFYDARGRPTGHLRWLEAQAARAKSEEEQQREAEAQWPACNVRWTEKEGSMVWCDGGAYPRKLISSLPGGNKPTARCACFEQVGWSDVRQLYPGCPPDYHECKILQT